MKIRTLAILLALPLALSLGAAQAQLKAPTKSKPKDPLGSGLGLKPSETVVAPAAEEKGPTLEGVVQDIADCVLAGLPQDWTLAQIEVTELGRDGKQREFEAKYSYRGADGKGAVFTPCDLRAPAMNVYKLNAALEPDKRNWTRATLLLSKDGKFELQYDYPKKEEEATPAPVPADPAPAPARNDGKKK